MDVFEFAKKYMYPFKVKGDNIYAHTCLFCHGGKHNDKFTFGISITKKIFGCMRGTCGASGTFQQLCEVFGEVADKVNFELHSTKKPYKKPTTKINVIISKAEEYLKLRKISRETMDHFGIGSDDENNIIFPYYDENNELVFVKFRPARKLKKGERKMWRESGTKPILFGINHCNPEFPLVICEGEIDALSCHESGIHNAVSVPSGTQDMEWIDNCWNWLKQFKEIILFCDNDGPGKDLSRDLIKKFNGEYIVKTVQYTESVKDANELLFKHGKDSVYKVISQAEEVPVIGLIRLYDVKPLDVQNIPRTPTGVNQLDAKIRAFIDGEVSVWTGKRGEGKSTALGQFLLETINQGKKACAYSGEMRSDWFQYWFDLQAAGRDHVESYVDIAGKREYYVPKKTKQLIHEWYKDYIWLYDNDIVYRSDEEIAILKVFEYAVKRHNCKVLLVDNLMTAKYNADNENDYYRKQGLFTGELVSFAAYYGVHIHLVAHPKKGSVKGCDDVSGLSDITNRVHNVFSWTKLSEEECLKYDANAAMDIFKNRSYGASGKIRFKYDQISRRLFNLDKKYGWEHDNQEKAVKKDWVDEIQGDETLPWDKF